MTVQVGRSMTFPQGPQVTTELEEIEEIGLLQLAITWYKIRHAGGQAHYYSLTGTLKQRDLNQ